MDKKEQYLGLRRILRKVLADLNTVEIEELRKDRAGFQGNDREYDMRAFSLRTALENVYNFLGDSLKESLKDKGVSK